MSPQRSAYLFKWCANVSVTPKTSRESSQGRNCGIESSFVQVSRSISHSGACFFSQSKFRRSVTTSSPKQSAILEAKGIGALMPSMSVAVPYYTASLALLLAFAILRFLFCTLLFRKFVVRLFIKFAGAELSKEVFGDSLFGWEMYKAVTATLMTDLQKKAKRGLEAPNPPLFSADGQSRSHLLDFARESRPLVVNFGSCTCPVFMERLREFNDVMTEFSDIADFLVIYISEAHPTDGWAFKVIISSICRKVECFLS